MSKQEKFIFKMSKHIIRLNKELTSIHKEVLENLNSIHGALLYMTSSEAINLRITELLKERNMSVYKLSVFRIQLLVILDVAK
jgi:hypothetical protein